MKRSLRIVRGQPIEIAPTSHLSSTLPSLQPPRCRCLQIPWAPWSLLCTSFWHPKSCANVFMHVSAHNHDHRGGRWYSHSESRYFENSTFCVFERQLLQKIAPFDAELHVFFSHTHKWNQHSNVIFVCRNHPSCRGQRKTMYLSLCATAEAETLTWSGQVDLRAQEVLH